MLGQSQRFVSLFIKVSFRTTTNLCPYLVVVLILSLFILVNYLIYMLLKLITGHHFIALPTLLICYYFLIRRVVTYVIFPGSLPLFRRKLENDMQKSMGRMILEQVREFSLCLDMFTSGGTDPSVDRT